jgi:1-acyl-sn-glycerol-3-phosphate acyltransferase
MPPSHLVQPPSPLLLKWFTWYSRRHVRKHFHAMRISLTGLPPQDQARPIVVYSNHPGWWDPLIGLLLKAHFYPEKTLHAPIDAKALEKYGILKKLGFFPVEQSSFKGARDFLRTSQALLQSPATLLAITPQGNFADPRQRPTTFEPGLSHLASVAPQAIYLPCAIEYPFWNERLPEALVRVGPPVTIPPSRSARQLNLLLQSALQNAQDALAQDALTRDPALFQTLITGSSGQAPVYDFYRSLKAKLTGKPFNPEHSQP